VVIITLPDFEGNWAIPLARKRWRVLILWFSKELLFLPNYLTPFQRNFDYSSFSLKLGPLERIRLKVKKGC